MPAVKGKRGGGGGGSHTSCKREAEGEENHVPAVKGKRRGRRIMCQL